MRLECSDGEFCIDASLLGEFLGLSPLDVQASMRRHGITSLCERGEGEDEGRYRLTFFHKSRRVRLEVDGSGHILWSSIIDFGNHPLPRSMRGAGAP